VVPSFDSYYVEGLLRRVAGAEPSEQQETRAVPLRQMIEHFCNVLRYSMGRGEIARLPRPGLLARMAGPFVLRGIAPLPRSACRCFEPAEDQGQSQHGDIETLHALLEEYLMLVQTGELNPPPHPFFGAIGVDGWADFHILHFERHLKALSV